MRLKVIQPEQIGIYLKAAEDWGALPMFYLELTSGLRRGELLTLLWTDIDTKKGTVSVSKSVNRLNGELKVSQPKTANSIRTVSIPQQTVDLLIKEHEQHPNNPYMFPSPVTDGMYGVDIKTLSGILGHYSAGFTLDTYTHATEKMQRDAANKMGNFMQQAM